MQVSLSLQIVYGRKDRPEDKEAEQERQISGDSPVPPVPPNGGPKTPKKASSVHNYYYVVEIPALAEPSAALDFGAGAVLAEIQLAKQLAKQCIGSHVCRDSVGSC